MKKYFALALCLLSAGCTDADWDRALNHVSPDQTVAASAPPPQPPAAAPDNTDFCRAVATQDATGNGFDAATQASVMARSYAQCVAIYTR
ncbi:MAG TPA: hypothetical protein VJS47_09290 [Rhizomicrobium sp.]|nr:hypothetical protein [Rhizomicrobium sp.]